MGNHDIVFNNLCKSPGYISLVNKICDILSRSNISQIEHSKEYDHINSHFIVTSGSDKLHGRISVNFFGGSFDEFIKNYRIHSTNILSMHDIEEHIMCYFGSPYCKKYGLSEVNVRKRFIYNFDNKFLTDDKLISSISSFYRKIYNNGAQLIKDGTVKNSLKEYEEIKFIESFKDCLRTHQMRFGHKIDRQLIECAVNQLLVDDVSDC